MEKTVRTFYILWSFLEFCILTNAKEYRFCSKDTNQLFSFTSESCPGGVFLKEPLSIDTSCYCHDSDVEIYNYCDLDKDTKSKTLIPHSPLGCQKHWSQSGVPKNAGHNKVRLILLKREQTTPHATEKCQLKCSNHPHTMSGPGKHSFVIEGPKKGRIDSKPFYPQEELNTPNAKINQAQGLRKDDSGSLEMVPFRSRRTDEERLDLDENVDAQNDGKITSETHKYPVADWAEEMKSFEEIGPDDGKYPVLEWGNAKEDHYDEGSERGGSRKQGFQSSDGSSGDGEFVSQPEPSLLTQGDITFPEFPDLKLTEEEEKFVYEIPAYIASISKLHKKPAERNFFKLLKHVFRIFEGMVSTVLIEPSFLNDLYSIFYKLFGEIDENMQCNSLTDIRFRKIVSSLERCTPIPIVFMQKKDSCPPKLVKAVRNNETSDHCEISLSDPKYVLSDDKTFNFPKEDIVIGTIWKMIDSVVAMCAQTFKDHGNMASLNYFVVAMEKLLMQDMIQEKWFLKVMNSEVYKGILLYEDYKLLATYMDQIDIGAHITGKKWTSYLKKPKNLDTSITIVQPLIPVGEKDGSSRKRQFHRQQPGMQTHRSRVKRSPLVSQGHTNINSPKETKKQDSSDEYTWQIAPLAHPMNASSDLVNKERKRPNGTNSGAGVGFEFGIQTIKNLSNYLIPVKNVDEISRKVVDLKDNSVNEEAAAEHSTETIASGTTEVPLKIIRNGQNIEIDLNRIMNHTEVEIGSLEGNASDIYEYYYVSEEVDDDEIPGDNDLIAYEKHLIWGGTAYCLQTLNASMPVSIDNVYPNVHKLCHKFNYKCQPPVSEQALLQSAVLDNCIANGWESIFLRSNLEMKNNQIVVCCYDSRICTKNSKECKEKCKNYCLSIGSNPQAENWMSGQEEGDPRCKCSTDPNVQQNFVNLLMNNLNTETNASLILQNSALLNAIPMLE